MYEGVLVTILSFRWRGDYGGKKSHWFPSNYVEVIEPDDNSDNMPFGAMQKGTIDIAGCSVGKYTAVLIVCQNTVILKEQTHQNSAKYTNMCPGLAKPV
jgi:hypothetical protein